MINWPDSVVDSIARKKSVLFLGSGISANSRSIAGCTPLTWGPFLQKVIEQNDSTLQPNIGLLNELMQKHDYLTACEIITEIISAPRFSEAAENEFRRPGFLPHEIHEIIFGIDSRIVITPNIDKIYEQYASSISRGDVVIKTYDQDDLAAFLRKRDTLIIKSHGSIDHPSKMIFTRKQYTEARYKYSSFYKIIDALLLTHTFIFLGCGIDDPDIQLLLENYNFQFPHCSPHYFIAPTDAHAVKIASSLKNNRNIEVIPYSSENEHSELLESLRALREQVSELRQAMGASTSW